MNDKRILTVESVTKGHPDKLCDTIADRVLDACLANDPAARVACEVMATAGKILLAGEITAKMMPDIPAIIGRTVRNAGYSTDYEIEVITHGQSEDIADAVDGGARIGAGDQGIVYGYACDETDQLLPMPVVLEHRLTHFLTEVRESGLVPDLLPDGKAQVSVEYRNGEPERLAAVVLSCQHEKYADLERLRHNIREFVLAPALWPFPPDQDTAYLINPSGRFAAGGFDADTGVTGRKLMVDTYGGIVPHGGGALSGKDGTKIDRSGTYMARYIAKNIVAAGLAKRCTVSLAYAIGVAEPIAMDMDCHGTSQYPESLLKQAVRSVFDLTPSGMIRTLGLDQPTFSQYCNYGHFTHRRAPWEQVNCADKLLSACEQEKKETANG